MTDVAASEGADESSTLRGYRWDDSHSFLHRRPIFEGARLIHTRRPKRVLVIGWGFVGSAIGQELLARGMSVVGLTRSPSTRRAEALAIGIEVNTGDVCDIAVAEAALDCVDHVVFAAGGLLPPSAAQRPLDDALGTLSPLITVLELLRQRRSVPLTYLSSGGTVYGDPVRNPARESDPARPISPYGVSRLAAESYSQMYSGTYGVPVQVVRCANVYGPGQDPGQSQGAVAVFLHRVLAGLPLQIVGDGSATRDYIYVADVARAVTSIIAGEHEVGVVNLGSGRGHSVLEVAELVSRTVGLPAVLEFAPARPTDVQSIVLDITRLRSFIDFTPVDLRSGLRQTWDNGRAARPPSEEGDGMDQVAQIAASIDCSELGGATV